MTNISHQNKSSAAMNKYPTSEDYIGDLSDLEPKRSFSDKWEFFLYMGLAFLAGIGAGVSVF